ncbi:MAG: hypothetical protein ACE5K7_04415, partial [Phycisphaerae bacterium]
SVPDEALRTMELAQLRQRVGAGSAAVSDGFLANAQALILQRRADARRRSRIEAIEQAIKLRWPQAEIEDCGDHLVVWLDGRASGAGAGASTVES